MGHSCRDSWAIFGDRGRYSHAARGTGSRRWMPTYRTTRLILSSCGMPCPATTRHWVGGQRGRMSVSKRVISGWANWVRNVVLRPINS